MNTKKYIRSGEYSKWLNRMLELIKTQKVIRK
jgi:hypothetical protein